MPDYEEWYAETDPEKLWQTIERIHKMDCLSNVNEVIKLFARKAYHSLSQGAFETLVQYSDCYQETYQSNKENCPDLKQEQSIDFFTVLIGRGRCFEQESNAFVSTKDHIVHHAVGLETKCVINLILYI